MLTALEILLSAYQEDSDLPTTSTCWSGMIPVILELGSRSSGGDLDATTLDDLSLLGMIDVAGAGPRPVLTKDGLAAYEYLTRL